MCDISHVKFHIKIRNFWKNLLWLVTHVTNCHMTNMTVLPLNYWGNSGPENVLKHFLTSKESKIRVKIKIKTRKKSQNFEDSQCVIVWNNVYVFNSLQLQYFSINWVIFHQIEICKGLNTLEFNSGANGVLGYSVALIGDEKIEIERLHLFFMTTLYVR